MASRRRALALALLTGALFLAFLPASGHAETFGNFTYEVDGGNVTITDYPTSVAEDVVVPATIEGMPVIAIGEDAFFLADITSIELPDSLRSIGESAFVGCDQLTEIVVPIGVSAIEYRTFFGCSGLTSIQLPETIQRIDEGAFISCSSLTTINLPDALNLISDSLFTGCTALTEITLPDGIASIGEDAFLNCSSLTSLEIPVSVTTIDEGAFSQCTGLTSISPSTRLGRTQRGCLELLHRATGANTAAGSLDDWRARLTGMRESHQAGYPRYGDLDRFRRIPLLRKADGGHPAGWAFRHRRRDLRSLHGADGSGDP